MGLKKYTGPLHTVEHAMMAHAVLTVTCQNCKHKNQMFAWRLYNAVKDKMRLVTMPLDKPTRGFRCKWCRRSVAVVIRVAGIFEYGT